MCSFSLGHPQIKWLSQAHPTGIGSGEVCRWNGPRPPWSGRRKRPQNVQVGWAFFFFLRWVLGGIWKGKTQENEEKGWKWLKCLIDYLLNAWNLLGSDFFHSCHFPKIWSWYQYKRLALVVFFWIKPFQNWIPSLELTASLPLKLMGLEHDLAPFFWGAFAVRFSEGTFGFAKNWLPHGTSNFLEDHPRTCFSG